MSAKKQGNRYTKEFKQQLVDLYHANHSVLELSKDYGPSTVTIYKWINEMKVVATATGEQITTKELAALQKRIQGLEIDNASSKKLNFPKENVPADFIFNLVQWLLYL